MKTSLFTRTRTNLPVFLHQWNENSTQWPHLLLIGGVHGDEIEGVAAARGLLDHLISTKATLPQLRISLIPEFNPEGVLLKSRGNSAGVDLNRNLPTKDWTADYTTPRYFPGRTALSEPENKALVQLLELDKPDFIISLHSYKPMLNVNGECPEAEIIGQRTGYDIVPDIGYPTPGSLGTYAGLERKISTLTYEIERGLSLDRVLKEHIDPIVESFKVTENRRK